MSLRLPQLVARLLGARPELATVDYYFLSGLGRQVALPGGGGPIVRQGPHTFEANDRLVVIRYATASELALIAGRRWQRVHYVIDDMLPIAGTCPELPDAYRQRLATFAANTLPRILDAGPEIVAPRPETLDLFAGLSRALLDPAYLHVAADHGHFERLATDRQPGGSRVAFLGTRSHGAGLAFLGEIVAALERRALPVRLTLFLGKHLPATLRRSAIIDNRAPLDWPAFRRFQQTERFHAMLAPLPDTPFNKGRSISKLLDAAAIGAVGLYSNRAPFAGRVSDGVDGLLLADDPRLWADAIAGLHARPAHAQAIAVAGAALARRLGDPKHVAGFWGGRLGLAEATNSA